MPVVNEKRNIEQSRFVCISCRFGHFDNFINWQDCLPNTPSSRLSLKGAWWEEMLSLRVEERRVCMELEVRPNGEGERETELAF